MSGFRGFSTFVQKGIFLNVNVGAILSVGRPEKYSIGIGNPDLVRHWQVDGFTSVATVIVLPIETYSDKKGVISWLMTCLMSRNEIYLESYRRLLFAMFAFHNDDDEY